MNENLIVQMVKDLENTRYYLHGYSYVRTLRNILVGNPSAVIAPHFKNKPYYGLYDYLALKRVEMMFDAAVAHHVLEVIYTDRGKLYCTSEYYVEK